MWDSSTQAAAPWREQGSPGDESGEALGGHFVNSDSPSPPGASHRGDSLVGQAEGEADRSHGWGQRETDVPWQRL